MHRRLLIIALGVALAAPAQVTRRPIGPLFSSRAHLPRLLPVNFTVRDCHMLGV